MHNRASYFRFDFAIKIITLVLTLLCFASLGLTLAQTPNTSLAANARPSAKTVTPRVLLISLDGLDTRYLHDADRLKLRIPTLRGLMREGATAKGVVSVYPTLTYPNHTTLVTGVHPARHGIFGNSLFEVPDGRQTGGAHWFAQDIQVDTLWDAASRARLTTGMVSFPVAGGSGDYNVPEIWQPGGTLEESRAQVARYARPRGLIEEVERRTPDLYRNFTKDEGDDARTRFAEYILREKRPELMLVHLYDFDHYQHDFGPFTPEAIAILEKTDAYVARLLTALEQAGTRNETTIFITSDHGFMPIDKQFHPGVLLAQQGLIRTREDKDAKGIARTVVTDWQALPYVTGGACAVIMRDAADAPTLAKIQSIFQPLVGDGKALMRVLNQQELSELGSNTRAAVMLEANDGYTFGGNLSGQAITASRSRGMHGYLPTRPAYRASFIATGPGIAARKELGEIRMIDIAPTIARTLGITLRDTEGQAIEFR